MQSQTNFQDEDREKKGEENVVCSISSRFFAFKLQFCRFFKCSCGFLASVLACLLFFVSYAFPLLLILFLWCHFWFRKMLIHYHSSWPAGQGQKKPKEGNKQACL